MQHPDEGLIHTWLDGELSDDEAASLEAHIAECSECRARVAEARGLVAASSRIVSALDIVPSGVIPAVQSRRRPWYSGTQFRAAAALMIVAGASLLVMRNQDKTAMDSVMSASAPVSAASEAARDTTASDEISAQAEPEPAAAAATTPSAGRAIAPKEEASTRVSETPAPSPTPAPPAPPPPVSGRSGTARGSTANATALSDRAAGARAESSAFISRADTAFRRVLPQLNEVVVTGVATEADGSELRKVRSDTTQSVSRTVFAVANGVEVTLTDAPPPAARLQARQRKADAVIAAAAAPAANVPSAADAAKTVVNTITWTDKRGHNMTLTGPLPKDQLELLRKRLPEDQR